jgi:ribosomal protein S18 acetylase RimI-like enzyme
MDIQYYRDSVNHHGVTPTLVHAAYRAANRVTDVALWSAMRIDLATLNADFRVDVTHPPGRMVEAEAMREHVDDPENLLTDSFIDDAARKGDRCYVLCDGDTVMSYGWYSTKPTTLVEVPGGAVLHFSPSHAYMYNAFTRPTYRGRRLHGIGMAAALTIVDREGLDGLLAYVVSSNFSSLKSFERLGFETIGHLLMLGAGGRHFWRATAGCRRYGLRVEMKKG